MIIGAYTLNLYCVNDPVGGGEGCKNPHILMPDRTGEFVGQNERSARRRARRSGWRFTKGDVICPWCTGKKTEYPA